jgi:hypothetical protein
LREIPLTRGQVALIDDGDYELVSRLKWYAHWSSHTKTFYARTTVLVDGKWKGLLLHRMLLGLTDSSIHADHENLDTLDNRRSNIRVATRQQNSANRRAMATSKHGFKGVRWRKDRKRWIAVINSGKKQYRLGSFATAEEAHAAYAVAAPRFFGEFARSE